MKALVVEDDADMLDFFRLVLGTLGYEVTPCETAEAALEAWQAAHHPLVMLDWLLAGMDGLTACRRLRSLPDGDSSVILVITARNQPGDLQAVLEAGADDYLAKPIDPNLLTVRLTIAARLVQSRTERRKARERLDETMAALEKSHDDLLYILNELRVGSALADREGRITFLSRAAQAMLGLNGIDCPGRPWAEVLPFEPEGRAALSAMVRTPAGERTRLSLHAEGREGRRTWLEVDVRDDPRDPQRKMFLFYDMSEVYDLRRQLDERAGFHDLVGRSRAMSQVYQLIRDVAAVDYTVLVEGETGTGKELVARAIHLASPRRDRPFVAVNCAGLTDSLLNSQLFGHKRGAFTGAVEDQIGLFEAASGGTLFLDEIGDIPMSVQTSLLRVLQEKEITRVGESKPRRIDVRIVAATHRDLSQEVERGRFRADLFYRIRVARITLPPLRERREDIPLLVATFLHQIRAATERPVQSVSNEAMRVLLDAPWPGNVRELKSAIEFASIRCRRQVIQVDDLPPELRMPGAGLIPVREDELDERGRILAALSRARGNRVAAARILGVSRATLYRHLARYDIKLEE